MPMGNAGLTSALSSGRTTPISGNGLARMKFWKPTPSVPEWHHTASEVARVPGRLALGTTMTYHGVSKLTPEGRRQTAGFFDSLGIRPGPFWATAVGLTEAISGICFITGIATRPAAVGVLATQAVAVAKVHREKGFRIEEGGYEFNLALMAIALGHLIAGPGKASAHWGLRTALHRRKRWWERIGSGNRHQTILHWLG